MKSLAEALVYAVAYISLKGNEDESYDIDEDIHALGSIADYVNACSEAEKAALREAAGSLLQKELASPLYRPEFVGCYTNWMNGMFSEEYE